MSAPADVIENEELCASFNAYVRHENELRASEIASGKLAALEESSPDFVRSVSGIRRRHVWEKHGILDPRRMVPDIPDRADDVICVQAELARDAAIAALESAGRAPDDVDLVIVGASAHQRPYPAIAIEVAHALRARGIAYDLAAGCASGALALQLASESIAAGSARCALVCAAELPSAYANFRDRDTHFILGDAAAALVVERVEGAREGAFEIVSSFATARYSTNVRNNVGFMNRCDPGSASDPDKLFYQEGRRVFKDIVQMVPAIVSEALGRAGVAPEAVARYWLHQANSQMSASIMRRLLGRETTPEEAPSVLEEYGNTAAAGALIAFDHHRAGMTTGAFGVLCAFGAGYTVSGHLLRAL